MAMSDNLVRNKMLEVERERLEVERERLAVEKTNGKVLADIRDFLMGLSTIMLSDLADKPTTSVENFGKAKKVYEGILAGFKERWSE